MMNQAPADHQVSGAFFVPRDRPVLTRLVPILPDRSTQESSRSTLTCLLPSPVDHAPLIWTTRLASTFLASSIRIQSDLSPPALPAPFTPPTIRSTAPPPAPDSSSPRPSSRPDLSPPVHTCPLKE